ncbi:MAG: S8 family peptidase [Spirochaetales bacterium]|nr:S8 family peptidase [Spirochaetales bacterium]
MAKEKYPHIFLTNKGQTIEYVSPKTVIPKLRIPVRDRIIHAQRIKEKLDKVWNYFDKKKEQRKAISMPDVKSGCYIDVLGATGADLIYKSLENIKYGIKLCNVKEENIEQNQPVRATVFIPENMRGYFLKKVKEYAEKTTNKGNPKNKNLVESIEDIKLAVIESFWQPIEDISSIPFDSKKWCEIWLSSDREEVYNQFKMFCDANDIKYQDERIVFPEKTVCIAFTDNAILNLIIESFPYLAEIRAAKETAAFWMELPNIEQAGWVENLLKRLAIAEKSKTSICILDSGINKGHKLIEPLLDENDMDSWDITWGKNDDSGHGTLLAGISIYGSLEECLQTNIPVTIHHSIESVKVLPPKGKNPKHLYGAIIIQSISKAEINNPNRNRVTCLAVTDKSNIDRGRPSSWSGAIDKLSSGADDNIKRLIILCAGNAMTEQNIDFTYKYPDSNMTDSIHDPGQSWNAITVGAHTEKVRITDPELEEYTPIAKEGELSPYSTTSAVWDKKWPVKPDIVMEGGNLAQGKDGFISSCDDLSCLSTYFKPIERQFGIMNQTSCAAAKASWFAAQIISRYPEAWPETIRALIVHSANWSDAMKKQFLSNENKTEYTRLLKTCGYGIPSFEKAIECTSNSLTMIVQNELQPFDKKNNSYKTKDMHIYELPWPKEELISLKEIEVELRMTLSYFIEPGPGEIGWKDRYRYASHGLRFRLNKSTEKLNDFIKRINKLAREEDEENKYSSSDKWLFGATNREKGSIHSDIWKGTAMDLASCNLIGIYPVIGWWRERQYLQKWNKKARYSLVVSIYSPKVDVDIYTPVKIKVETPVEIKIPR